MTGVSAEPDDPAVTERPRAWWQVWRYLPDWSDHDRSAQDLGLDTAHDNEACLNCKTPLTGPFCHVCGQRDDDFRRPFLSLSNELLADTFQWDSRILRSVVPFLVLPGTMTRAFMSGHRGHYVTPLRLYIVVSLLFFTLLTFSNVAILKFEVRGIAEVIENAVNDTGVPRPPTAPGAVASAAGYGFGLAGPLSVDFSGDDDASAGGRDPSALSWDDIADLPADQMGEAIRQRVEQDLAASEARRVHKENERARIANERIRIANERARMENERVRLEAEVERARLQAEARRQARESRHRLLGPDGAELSAFDMSDPSKDDPQEDPQDDPNEDPEGADARAELEAQIEAEALTEAEKARQRAEEQVRELEGRGIPVPPPAPTPESPGPPDGEEDGLNFQIEDFENVQFRLRMFARINEADAPNDQISEEVIERILSNSDANGEARVLGERVFQAINLALADPRVFNRIMNEWLPRVMVILVPLLAFLLAILYGRKKGLKKRVYFIDHLVFSFHFHAFIFFLMALGVVKATYVGDVIDGSTTGLFFLTVIAAYLFIAMKRVYEQGYIKTTLKFAFLAVTLLTLYVSVIVSISIYGLLMQA